MSKPWKPLGPKPGPKPTVVIHAPAEPCPLPHFSAGENVPVASSTADLKAGPYSLATAIVAPKEGDIAVPAGTPIVVLAKNLRDSPTFKKAFGAVCVAWGAYWAYIIIAVLVLGGPFALDQAHWIGLLKDATYPALVTLAGVYGIKVKLGDNDAIVNASLKKP